ncbi:pyridoxal phosphate-dependent aminotransferase [Serratia plymuthica]|uniref:pyridoxal phosphate-dependent aminotransferase n=1 Tax=Serratia plymuthica TaxID=82996 RepID=UPI002DB8B34A|nr:pyridoxal phosphate-dependent aminotransferase [Serratia plymuthica]MEB6538945.1 pyridoxal phosphate-dependent aminotransferase [Serratia plymuthica]
MPAINAYLEHLNPLSSKTVSQRAKANPAILNLSMGEPDFGPPAALVDVICREDLNKERFLDAVKRYEHSRGSLSLRRAIAAWYRRRYAIDIDPESEIMVTHGGIEALNLALQALTNPGDGILLAAPAYTLYQRAIHLLNRKSHPLPRPEGENEYAAALAANTHASARAVLINSPENPTGYVMSDADWQALADDSHKGDRWVIHDEVYDTLAFTRPHLNAWCIPALRERSVLINSCSKKFGIPGLRTGWLIGPAKVIEAASRVHESLCLGVSILGEPIAERLLSTPEVDDWMQQQQDILAARNRYALSALGETQGFRWSRCPMGGMFLFPDVSALYPALPTRWRDFSPDAGSAVAEYLLVERQVATVPGIVYGAESRQHLRLTNCASEQVFNQAIARLSSLELGGKGD